MQVSLLEWILCGCCVFMLVNEGFSTVTVTGLVVGPWVVGGSGIESKNKEEHIGIDNIHVAL